MTPNRATVLFNADVRSMEAANPRADAVAWLDGALIAVGTQAEVERAVGPERDDWDVAGATVLPGFIDAHHHTALGAIYGGAVQLSPPAVTDIGSLQRALSSAAEGLSPGSWLVATGWDEQLLAERRAPTRQEIDEAVPDRPVMALHYSYHRALANSRALELAGIGRETPDPSGGVISRGRGGLPDGLLIERAMSRVETMARASLLARDVDGFVDRVARHHRALVAAGLTRIVDAMVPADLASVYREAAHRGALTVPTVMMPASTSGYLDAPWDILDGPKTGTVDGFLEVGPIKLVFDGAPTCAMCLDWWQLAGVTIASWAMAIRHRSLDVIRTTISTQPRIGRSIRTGIQLYQRDEASKIVRAAVDRGFSLATHAIGNEAIDVALSAYTSVGSSLADAGVPRLEHATFLDRELVARIAAVGAAVVAQPDFVRLPAFASAPPIPKLKSTPLRWLLDRGVKVAGSSDYPVFGFDPLDGIRSAIHRRTRLGEIHEPDQRVALDEALLMYTRTAAEVSGCGDRVGTLSVGKRADIVILDRTLDERSLDQARVRATVIGGKVVFGALGVSTR